MNSMKFDEKYWTDKYIFNKTGWDTGGITIPLKEYIDQIEDKNINILIPGGGNSYEAEYLHVNGFSNIYVADISQKPLQNLKNRLPDFPDKHLLHIDFFKLDQKFDLILEQTFFCALYPGLRQAYAIKMNELLNIGGKLVGLLFEGEFGQDEPPFGGNRDEYKNYFQPFFNFKHFDRAYNSIKPRQGKELFICFQKKDQ
jgi:methyl halide transferase